MEKSFGLFFHLKTTRKTNVKELPIYLCITVNKISCEISTRQKCDSSKWNATAGRIESKTQVAKLVNDYLDIVERKLYEIRKQLLDNDQPVTAENIKTLLQGREIKGNVYMLMLVFQRHNEQMAELVHHDFAPATLTRYNTCYKHTLSFLQWKYKVTDIDIARLDYEFMSEYEFWLKSVRKCDHNTAMHPTEFQKDNQSLFAQRLVTQKSFHRF